MALAMVLFWLLAALTGLSAVMVVRTADIVRAAVWLLFTLVGTACLYFLLGFDFVGASQLIVYVGGTLVLVVFGVMLTAQGPFVQLRTLTRETAGIAAVGLVLLGTLLAATAFAPWPTPDAARIAAPAGGSTNPIGASLLGVTEATPPAPLTGLPADTAAPERTRIAYLLPFEVVSLHLLVVLIGAAYLARAKRRAPRPDATPEES